MSTSVASAGKSLIKKKLPPSGNQWRPVTVTIAANFPKQNARKVTPADLEKAAAAAAAAFRAALEGRTPAYEILDLTASVTYSYVQVNTVQKL